MDGAKKMRRQAFIIVLLLVVVVFSIGVIVGNTWDSMRSEKLSKVLRMSDLEAESFLIEEELFKSFDSSCDLAKNRLTKLTSDLWDLGKVLGKKDAKEQLGAQDYDYLKKKYHLTQIRTYILGKKLKDDCANDLNVILYYFKQGGRDSERQGVILDELVSEYDLVVFAVELGYSKELRFLEEYYGASEAPFIVVNYGSVFNGLTEKEKIAEKLYG